jgi:hypothetical protein
VHHDQIRPFVPDITQMFMDFLRRAKEPISVEHLWKAVLVGLTQGPDFLFLVALDISPGERFRFTGYLLAQAGQDFYGIKYGNVVQVYAIPGVKGVVDALNEKLEEWATQSQIQMLSGLTHRAGRGYTRWMQRLGWIPSSVMYVKLREVEAHRETAASPADYAESAAS